MTLQAVEPAFDDLFLLEIVEKCLRGLTRKI